MSRWTHVLGIIRFEDVDKNIWPKPRVDRSERKANLIHKLFQRTVIPSGSEGPLNIQTIITDRGPTVILTGDLRDFDRENINEICEYLNKVINIIKEDKRLIGKELPMYMSVRDAMINCDIEYYEKKVIIYFDFDSEPQQFKIMELPLPKKKKNR